MRFLQHNMEAIEWQYNFFFSFFLSDSKFLENSRYTVHSTEIVVFGHISTFNWAYKSHLKFFFLSLLPLEGLRVMMMGFLGWWPIWVLVPTFHFFGTYHTSVHFFFQFYQLISSNSHIELFFQVPNPFIFFYFSHTQNRNFIDFSTIFFAAFKLDFQGLQYFRGLSCRIAICLFSPKVCN